MDAQLTENDDERRHPREKGPRKSDNKPVMND